MATVLTSSSDTADQIAAAVAGRSLTGPRVSPPAASVADTPPADETPTPASAPDVPPAEPSEEPEPEERLTRGQRRIRGLEGQIEALLKQRTRLELENERLSARNSAIAPAEPPAPSPAPLSPPSTVRAPQQEQYASHAEYVQAWEQYQRAIAREEWERQDTQRREAEQQRQQTEAQQAQQRLWLQRVQEGRAKHDDWDEAWAALGPRLSGTVEGAVITAVLESDLGGELAHYLGTHLDELDKVRDLTPAALTRWLGRLEAQLESPPPPPPAPLRATAPPPIQPIAGTTAPQTQNTAREGEPLKDYMNRRGPMVRRRY